MNTEDRIAKHKHFQAENEKLKRGHFGVTLKPGESLEFSNGTTVAYNRARVGRQARLVIISPLDVRVYRGKSDEQGETSSG